MKVGDYVRTKDGRIGKISNLTVDYSSELILCEENFIPFAKHQIIKSSPNIIDLIEVGDYVNEYYVEDITNTGEELVLHIITGSNYFQSPFLYNEDIKSVLTHEQFEAMKYKVGDTNVKD